MTKIAAVLTFVTGMALALTIYGAVFAQTSTTTPTLTPVPTEVVPTSAPATGRG